MKYSIDKDEKLYLYGAATIGFLQHNTLSKKGYRILGFIDRRADEIKKFCELPVFRPDDKNLDKNITVIVSVKNVFEHSRIAKSLNDYGFSKIIYRPYNALNASGDDLETRLYNVYDEILNDNGITEIRDIPFYISAEIKFHGKIYTLNENGKVTAGNSAELSKLAAAVQKWGEGE